MKCYSIPRRLLHIAFGGSAIWLGTTFCSPLAAYDFDLPPTSASAPDALATPGHIVPPSIVPATSLEEVSHWDNGPVLEDELYNNDYVSADEYCDDYACEDEYCEDEYCEDEYCEDEYCDEYCEDEYCDEYAYDGYDSAMGLEDESTVVESEDADGLVDVPEESAYCDFEDSYDDFDDNYDEMYAHDEHTAADEDALDNSEDYTCEWEDEYCHGEDWGSGSDDGFNEVEAVEQAENDSYAYDEEHYEDYGYDEEYVYDYEGETGCDDAEMSSVEEEPQEVAATVAADDAEANEEDDFSYEFDDYEMYYGYQEDSAETAEEVPASQEEIVEDATESHESDWEDYYYGDEYQYESDSEPVAEEMAADETVEAEASAEEAWADEHEYDTYEYDYYDHDYDMETDCPAEAATEESADMWDESYDYVDPMDHYGYEYEVPSEWLEMEVEEPSEVELDLFAWQPTELLGDADCSLIQSIEQLSDQPATERRACLNNYIEALGFEAIDFAYRYEDATDSDVLTLANDLPGMAAFLASYRLVQQGQIGMDDAVLLLESALSGLSLDWIEAVSHIAEPREMVSASHPVVEAMACAATQSIATVSALAATISQRLADLPWSEFEGRLDEIRSAFRPLGGDDTFTF